MSNAKKFASTTTPRELNEWVHQVATYHGLQVEVTIRPSYQKPSYAVCEVKLYEIARLSVREPIKCGQAFIATVGEQQWGQILNIAYLVLQDYTNDPWNWSARDRIREQTNPTGPT